jgi:hypothetical protein
MANSSLPIAQTRHRYLGVMKNIRLQQALSAICFLPILALCGIKIFVFPALFTYLLIYFLLADAWQDTTFVPYMRAFITIVAPSVLAIGTAYLFVRFYPSPTEK